MMPRLRTDEETLADDAADLLRMPDHLYSLTKQVRELQRAMRDMGIQMKRAVVPVVAALAKQLQEHAKTPRQGP